jgi:hypothetical protein
LDPHSAGLERRKFLPSQRCAWFNSPCHKL